MISRTWVKMGHEEKRMLAGVCPGCPVWSGFGDSSFKNGQWITNGAEKDLILISYNLYWTCWTSWTELINVGCFLTRNLGRILDRPWTRCHFISTTAPPLLREYIHRESTSRALMIKYKCVYGSPVTIPIVNAY